MRSFRPLAILLPLFAFAGLSLPIDAGATVAPPPTIPSTVSMAWVFDYHVPDSQVVQDELAQNVGYVWGASAPELPGGPAVHDVYLSWQQGFCPGYGLQLNCPTGSPPSYPWLKKHHPNWILWQANPKGKATKIAQSGTDPGPIVNFTDPAVQKYWMQEFITPDLQAGYNGISWDHSIPYNAYGSVGHFNTSHHFVHQFLGTTEDPNYASEEASALSRFLSDAKGVKKSASFTSSVSDLCHEAHTKDWYKPLKYVQTIFDEAGYTDWGDKTHRYLTASPAPHCKNHWLAETKAYISLQRQGKWLVLDNQIPMTLKPNETESNRSVRALMDWALANYLLVKSAHTYFWFGTVQSYGYPVVMQREEQINYGTPTGPMASKQGVYMRPYSKGMAVVNPDPKRTITVTFPIGKYVTVYGDPVTKVAMGPHSGLLLQTSG